MEYLNFIKKQLQESLEGLSSAMIKKIVIATHVFTPGTSQAFLNYCKKKIL